MITIKSGDDISKIFTHGKRYKTNDLTIIVSRDKMQHGQQGRVAFIAGKRQGNAVWRNRAKRRMRAVYRTVEKELPLCDFLFVAKQSTTKALFSDLVTQTKSVIKKLN